MTRWLDEGPRFWPDEEPGNEVPETAPGPSLDSDQFSAATTTAHHVLVVAGPGAGKTRTLHGRAAHLLGQGADPERLLAMVFTNAAARELRKRIGRPDMAHVGTFHSLMLHLVVRPYADCFGLQRARVADDRDVLGVLRAVGEAHEKEHPGDKLPTDREGWEEWARIFSLAKNAMTVPESPLQRVVFDAYNAQLIAGDLVDFDDLLLLPVRLMGTDDAIRAEIAGSFDHVLVDEYQDTNSCQVELVRLLCSEGASLFAVGDPAQSIYGFRGADPGNIASLRQVFPDLVRYDLPVSYRCPTRVLDLANRIGASGLDLVPAPGNEGTAGVWARLHCPSPRLQGKAVAQGVAALIDKGVPASEITVLYRNHFVPNWDDEGRSTGLRLALRELGVPFYETGLRLTSRKEVADLLAWVKWALEPSAKHDALFPALRAWLSPTLGLDFGPEALAKAEAEAEATGRPLRHCLAGKGRSRKGRCPCCSGGSRLVELLIEAGEHKDDGPYSFLSWSVQRLDFEHYLEREAKDSQYVEELLALASRAEHEGATLPDFLDELALDDCPDDAGERVTLSTAHGAKGLEWRYVFVIGFDHGTWPSQRAVTDEEVAEERRLFYVAVTRAKESLVLFYTSPSSLLDALYTEEEAA